MLFSELGLSPEIINAVTEQGYTSPTPIQEQAIPIILEGKDVLAGAQTGTGKTAGFALPILQRLLPYANTSTSPARHSTKVLVLTPTRELAAQVEESFKVYSKYIPVRTAVIYGGVNMDAQTALLKSGVEIVVSTPGRLLDHVQQKTINLSQIEILILDEADRMLDMGFIKDIRKIIELLPAKKQSILFSATFSSEIKQLADTLLKDPVLIEVARRNAAADNIQQTLYLIEQEKKRALLSHLIESQNLNQVLVFCRTKQSANNLANLLVKDGINSAAIHSDKTQGMREAALEEFKAGTIRVLVATDIAARGIDIEDLPHVINFEVPHAPEDYVHRIGRTGRAGAIGKAISLVSPEELKLVKEVEKLLKRTIERTPLPEFMNAVEQSRPENPRKEYDRPSRHDKASKKPHAKPLAELDPIFTQPYIPPEHTSAQAQETSSRVPNGKSKPIKQIGVLLGGSKNNQD